MATLESLLNGYLPYAGGMTAVMLAYFALMLRSSWIKEQELRGMRRQLSRIEARQIARGK